MRSRAVRRLQQPARWVPEALQATLFTPLASHLNPPCRPRLQRLAYEEEARTLPKFIRPPTATAKHKHNPAEKFVTLPSDGESTTRQRQEEIPRERTQPRPSPSSSCVADTSTLVREPQVPKPARQLSRAEREDSIQTPQMPAVVDMVLMTAGFHNGNEIASWTEDQQAFFTAKLQELLDMDKFCVVEMVDRPPSQQVFSTRWGSRT